MEIEHKENTFSFFVEKNDFAIVKMIGSPAEYSDVQEYLDFISSLYQKKNEFCILFDASQVGHVPRKYLNMQVNFMRDNKQNTRKYMKKAAIVLTSPLTKALLDIIFRLCPPSTTVKIFGNKRSAWKFLAR